MLKHSEVIAIVRGQTGFEPTQSDIRKIIGISQPAMSLRVKRNSEYSKEELESIESFYGILGLTQYIVEMSCKPIPCFENPIGAFCNDKFYFYESHKFAYLSHSNEFNLDFKYSYFIMKCNTDSMLPSIAQNERIIVRGCEEEQIKDNKIYVFGYKDEIYIRRLVKNLDEIIIKSDNQDPIYKAKTVKEEEIKIIGQVVSSIRAF